MAIGALLSALAWNPGALIVARCFLGLGIGGDYSVSGVLMSEYANVKDRGRMVAIVFSMQALGLIAGPVVSLTLLASGIDPAWVWRLILGLGTLPASVIIYYRRRLPESPRYTAQVEGREAEASLNLMQFGHLGSCYSNKPSKGQRLPLYHLWREPRLFLTLLSTAGTWFLFDYAYYGNSISLPIVLNMVDPHATMLSQMAWSLMMFTMAAVPGYASALWRIDHIGHRRLQYQGFFALGLTFLAIGLVPALSHIVWAFMVVFGLSYFFAEFGPNTTTFVLSTEVFPVSLRTTGNGISAGMAKLGAFIGVFLFPTLTARWGLHRTLILTALCSFAGMGLTFLLPEPAGRALEDVTTRFVPIDHQGP
jgi:MFS family permease